MTLTVDDNNLLNRRPSPSPSPPLPLLLFLLFSPSPSLLSLPLPPPFLPPFFLSVDFFFGVSILFCFGVSLFYCFVFFFSLFSLFLLLELFLSLFVFVSLLAGFTGCPSSLFRRMTFSDCKTNYSATCDYDSLILSLIHVITLLPSFSCFRNLFMQYQPFCISQRKTKYRQIHHNLKTSLSTHY